MEIQTNDKISKRFWSKVDIRNDADCWNWQGRTPKDVHDRGKFSIRRTSIVPPRMAWIISRGQIPNGLCVLHKCDNGRCCNPDHLFLGTQKDNVRDMCNKGRKHTLKGEEDPKHKLSECNVKEIKAELAKENHMTQYEIARIYNVSRSAISAISIGRNWK